jgi:ribonuclease HI
MNLRRILSVLLVIHLIGLFLVLASGFDKSDSEYPIIRFYKPDENVGIYSIGSVKIVDLEQLKIEFVFEYWNPDTERYEGYDPRNLHNFSVYLNGEIQTISFQYWGSAEIWYTLPFYAHNVISISLPLDSYYLGQILEVEFKYGFEYKGQTYYNSQTQSYVYLNPTAPWWGVLAVLAAIFGTVLLFGIGTRYYKRVAPAQLRKKRREEVKATFATRQLPGWDFSLMDHLCYFLTLLERIPAVKISVNRLHAIIGAYGRFLQAGNPYSPETAILFLRHHLPSITGYLDLTNYPADELKKARKILSRAKPLQWSGGIWADIHVLGSRIMKICEIGGLHSEYISLYRGVLIAFQTHEYSHSVLTDVVLKLTATLQIPVDRWDLERWGYQVADTAINPMDHALWARFLMRFGEEYRYPASIMDRALQMIHYLPPAIAGEISPRSVAMACLQYAVDFSSRPYRKTRCPEIPAVLSGEIARVLTLLDLVGWKAQITRVSTAKTGHYSPMIVGDSTSQKFVAALIVAVIYLCGVGVNVWVSINGLSLYFLSLSFIAACIGIGAIFVEWSVFRAIFYALIPIFIYYCGYYLWVEFDYIQVITHIPLLVLGFYFILRPVRTPWYLISVAGLLWLGYLVGIAQFVPEIFTGNFPYNSLETALSVVIVSTIVASTCGYLFTSRLHQGQSSCSRRRQLSAFREYSPFIKSGKLILELHEKYAVPEDLGSTLLTELTALVGFLRSKEMRTINIEQLVAAVYLRTHPQVAVEEMQVGQMRIVPAQIRLVQLLSEKQTNPPNIPLEWTQFLQSFCDPIKNPYFPFRLPTTQFYSLSEVFPGLSVPPPIPNDCSKTDLLALFQEIFGFLQERPIEPDSIRSSAVEGWIYLLIASRRQQFLMDATMLCAHYPLFGHPFGSNFHRECARCMEDVAVWVADCLEMIVDFPPTQWKLYDLQTEPSHQEFDPPFSKPPISNEDLSIQLPPHLQPPGYIYEIIAQEYPDAIRKYFPFPIEKSMVSQALAIAVCREMKYPIPLRNFSRSALRLASSLSIPSFDCSPQVAYGTAALLPTQITDLAVYTDGSFNHQTKMGACAVVLVGDNKILVEEEEVWPTARDPVEMELRGVILGLKTAATLLEKVKSENITFFIDNQYALKVLVFALMYTRMKGPHPALNKLIYEQLDALRSKFHIYPRAEYVQTKTQYNKRADENAKNAAFAIR